MPRLVKFPIVIANGAQDSNEIDLTEFRVIGIQMPTAFTGATISFKSAVEETDANLGGPDVFQDVYDEGALVTMTVAASRYQAVADGNTRHAVECLYRAKIRSASAEGAARTLYLVCEPR